MYVLVKVEKITKILETFIQEKGSFFTRGLSEFMNSKWSIISLPGGSAKGDAASCLGTLHELDHFLMGVTES